jgi:hypothetical protein
MDNRIPTQDQLLDSLKSVQDKVVATVRDWTSAADGVVSDLPFADQFPKASEAVGQAIDFAGKVLERQREFVTTLLDTVGELYKADADAAAAAGTPAPKAPKTNASV